MRLTVALRSQLAFNAPDSRPSGMEETTDPVAMVFEGRQFVWHPATLPVDDRFGPDRSGPMLAVLSDDNDQARREALVSAQHLLSALAFKFDVSIESFMLGTGMGGDAIFSPSGSRVPHGAFGARLARAPHAIEVTDDPLLWRALGLYREGLNATSPFYECLAFRGVLDVVFRVTNETMARKVTPAAARRDVYVDTNAPTYASQLSSDPPVPAAGWAKYLRDDVRNAVSHVLRPGKREVDVDDPADRRRLEFDGRVMKSLAERAINEHWPYAVHVTTDAS